MKYLSVDFGEKRIGLAVCDPSETLVSPLGRIDRRDDRQAVEQIIRTVREEQIEAVVIGLPFYVDGTEGPQTKRLRQFAEPLAAELTAMSITLHFQAEQLTSFIADERLAQRDLTKKGQRRRQDAIAAAIILEDFLRSKPKQP